MPNHSANEVCNTVNDPATPLHFAALTGQNNNASLLLEKKADPNLKDSKGNTALHIACRANNLELVKLLDRFGAKTKIKNAQGQGAIDIAI